MTGIFIYMLVLLANNSLEQLLDSFISDEFFVCILLAFIVTESTRWLLINTSGLGDHVPDIIRVSVIIGCAMLVSVVLILIGLSLYFRYVIGYQPNLAELQPFIILYAGLSLALAAVYISHQYISRASAEILSVENQLKVQSEASFKRLTRGVNPDLLFETLEGLITFIQDDLSDDADEMIDNFSMIYRYALSKQDEELVPLSEEGNALHALVRLINQLPYRKVEIGALPESSKSIVPGSLLYIVEQIVKKTIVSKHQILRLYFDNYASFLVISYNPHDKINDAITDQNFNDINQSYTLYTDQRVHLAQEDGRRLICIPMLEM